MTPATDPTLDAAIRAAVAATGAAAGRALRRFASVAREVGTDAVDAALSAELSVALAGCWERGWAPSEVLHQAARTTDVGVAALALRLIREQAPRSVAAANGPAEWAEDVAGLPDLPPVTAAPDTPVLTRHALAEGLRAADAWSEGIRLLRLLTSSPAIPAILLPPSRWGTAPGPVQVRPAPGARHEPGLMARIRALLAKAESTTFPAEAAALADKARELMDRHRIVPVATGTLRPELRRVLITGQAEPAQAELLATIAAGRGVRARWEPDRSWVTLSGDAAELDRVEAQHLDLLVQAGRALAAFGRVDPPFRRAFLLGFAHRIGRRRATAAPAAQQPGAERPVGGEPGAGARTPAGELPAAELRADTATPDIATVDGLMPSGQGTPSRDGDPQVQGEPGRVDSRDPMPHRPPRVPAAAVVPVRRASDRPRSAALVARGFQRAAPATRVATRWVDAAGWEAGEAAADRAELPD